MKNFIYSLVEVITLGRGINRNISGEMIRFPAKWSRYYEHNYEPETFAFFRENLKAGDTVLDIGAHIGIFAVTTANLVGESGKVFSFEPTPRTREVLEQVVKLNNVSSRVEVRHEAVGEKRSVLTFFETGEELSNANSLVKTSRSSKQIDLPVISIDEFVEERKIKVDCIKIDVEGFELNLLKGARNTFLVMRPIARLGLHPSMIKDNGQSLSEIWDVLDSYKYKAKYNFEPVSKDWFIDQSGLFDVSLYPA